MGQHEAGKHSKAGKKQAAEQPRQPKSSKKGQTAGGVYHSRKPGLLGRLFGKKK